MARLSCHGLHHHFEATRPTLIDVSFSVSSGELVVLSGPNGSGKTVLMKHLNGLLRPLSGGFSLDGAPFRPDSGYGPRTVGLVFQNPQAQFLEDTVAADVAFGPRNLGVAEVDTDRRVENALVATGLEEYAERDPLELSGGEQQRLALAGVLAAGTPFIVLDEPFGHLDLPGVRSVLRSVLDARSSGKGVVVVTHDLDKILAHADRLVVMHAGRVALDRAPADCLDGLEEFAVKRPAGLLSEMSWL